MEPHFLAYTLTTAVPQRMLQTPPTHRAHTDYRKAKCVHLRQKCAANKTVPLPRQMFKKFVESLQNAKNLLFVMATPLHVLFRYRNRIICHAILKGNSVTMGHVQRVPVKRVTLRNASVHLGHQIIVNCVAKPIIPLSVNQPTSSEYCQSRAMSSCWLLVHHVMGLRDFVMHNTHACLKTLVTLLTD